MSNPTLPAELLDNIADRLNTTRVLRSCCLVSKSWIPRTRRHLFAKIKFGLPEELESWKRMFPDPSTSPACYTKTLIIGRLRAVTIADAEAGGWIRGFSRVAHLEVSGFLADNIALLLHGFSPAVKSLHIDVSVLSPSWIFSLTLSFPLLEDLRVMGWEVLDGGSPVIQPSNLPMFTGSLELSMPGMEPIVRQLLSLPGGIHFRRLTLDWTRDEDGSLTTALVERCSHTLESLSLACDPLVRSGPIDLSKATKLKDVVFRLKTLAVEWIVTALRTTIPEHRELRQISIRFSHNPTIDLNTIMGHPIYGQWLGLDRLLVQFLESRSTPPKVICTAVVGEKWIMRGFVECCLPELTRRGMIELGVHTVSMWRPSAALVYTAV